MELAAVDKALRDVRQAQRVLVAFYLRVKDIIQLMRKELGIRHCYWGTVQFSRPAGCNVDTLAGWSWDALPMADAYFQHTLDGNWGLPQATSTMVEIRLVSDSVFIEQGKGNGNEPSPLDMPPVTESSTYLRVTVYQIERSEQDDWGSDWSQALNQFAAKTIDPQGLTEDADWRVYRQRFDFGKLGDRAAVADEMSQFKRDLAKHGFTGFGHE